MAGSGVPTPSADARLANTSDLLGPSVHRAGTARGSRPRHTRIADRMQVAPQPGRSRFRVLVGRRFFRPGDGYSDRRHEVLVFFPFPVGRLVRSYRAKGRPSHPQPPPPSRCRGGPRGSPPGTRPIRKHGGMRLDLST